MSNRYKDFNIFFHPHPATGDVSVVSDEKAIAQAIKNLVLTDSFEIPFNSNMAGNIRGLLFELNDPFAVGDIKDNIRLVIENYEPRANIKDIRTKTSKDGYGIDVSIIYRAKTSTENITLQFYLDRVV